MAGFCTNDTAKCDARAALSFASPSPRSRMENALKKSSKTYSVSWVRDVVAAVKATPRCVGTEKLDWPVIKDTAMEYCQKKSDAGRFVDRGDEVEDEDNRKVPTWDLMDKKEIFP